ncbi:hypothetical protein MTO96_027616 [Rhipicephalus appendiculatus]
MRRRSRTRRRAAASNSGLEESYFSDSSINYRAPCTSSEGRPCDIFRNLRLWNEFFCPVGLCLKEYSPGELNLVEIGDPCTDPEVPVRKHEAAILLRHLLTYHRCLVSVQLNSCIFTDHHQLICDALPDSHSLRKLKLCLPSMDTRALQSFTAALPLQNSLRELECRLTKLELTFCEGLSEFLTSAGSLTTFVLGAPLLPAPRGEDYFSRAQTEHDNHEALAEDGHDPVRELVRQRVRQIPTREPNSS